jgi:hypothetical protein
MRFILGFLSGVLGMLAGWAGLAFLVISLAGPDRDGGIAMGAFFQIGPIGGVVGFIAGVWLFIWKGIVREKPSSTGSLQPAGEDRPARTRISRPFAVVILVLAGSLAWWGWYEFIRSPYLTHGFMTLQIQFKLPAGMALPDDVKDVQIDVEEGQQHTDVIFGEAWHGHEGDRKVILASATLSMKTSSRIVTLKLPGVSEQTWQLDLSSDPDPTPGYTPWHLSEGTSAPNVEMNFQLSADH